VVYIEGQESASLDATLSEWRDCSLAAQTGPATPSGVELQPPEG
jgi:hypothetical protein